MEKEPKFEQKESLNFDALKQEMIDMEGKNIDPENFAKYLVWSLARSGAGKDEILSAVERYNSEFPHFLLKEVEKPVTSVEGVNGGIEGPYFKFEKESVQ